MDTASRQHPLRYRSIGEIARALRRREFSAAELARFALDCLLQDGGPLNAVATALPDRAAEEAGRAQALLDADPDAAHLLCGVPYGAKDVIAATGGPTTFGSAYFRDQTFPTDAGVVAALRDLGGVLTAKLNTAELAGAGRAGRPTSSVHGQGLNPWNTSRVSGGSSSGPAIAVAIGALPYALGTETSGSVVGPAAYSGITGIRPTAGTVDRSGVMLLSPTLDKVGVLARTATDCGIVLDALRGRRQPVDSPRLRSRSDGSGEPYVVAFLGAELDECQPGARAVFAAAVEAFEGVGARLREDGLARHLRYADALSTVMFYEAAIQFRAALDDPAFRLGDPDQDAEFRAAREVTTSRYAHALRVRERAASEWRALFERVDLVLATSRPTTAPRLDQRRQFDPGHSDAVRASANLVGLPGIAFPCGFADDGLPVGLHLVGPAHSEDLLVRLAARFQELTDHHLARPPRQEGAAAGPDRPSRPGRS